MTAGRQPSGVVTIDGLPYFVAKNDEGVPRLQQVSVRTQEGDPLQPRRFPWRDWSRGMGDSQAIAPGAVEYAVNAYLGDVGRLLPGPKINTVTLPNSTATPVAFVEVTAPANRVIAFGGRYAQEINPTSHAVAYSEDLGDGKAATDAQVFQGVVAIAMGEGTQFKWRNASGVYADSTVTTEGSNDYRYATKFGLSVEGDLVRGRGAYWSKCADADFYGTNGNWTVEYGIADTTVPITDVFAFERWDYVLKEDGLYTFDSEKSKEQNVLPDLAAFRSTENRGWGPWYNRLFLCTFAGLYRYLKNGAARTVGIETVKTNQGTLDGVYPTAFVAFGEWAYVAYYNGTTTYICMMRNAMDGDVSWSPFTLTSVIDTFTGQCRAMVIPKNTSNPEVWYGRGVDMAWFQITRTGRPAVWRDSGTVRVVLPPNDLGTPFTVKYFRGFEVIGKNLEAGRAITLKASIDGGSENAVGAAVATSGYQERFWTRGTNDSGREIQPIVEMSVNSTSTPPELTQIALNFEERPEQVPGLVMVLRLRDGDREGDVVDRRTAYDVRADIEALLDGPIVEITDPYGDTYAAALAMAEGQTAWQYPGGMPQDEIAILARRLDYA